MKLRSIGQFFYYYLYCFITFFSICTISIFYCFHLHWHPVLEGHCPPVAVKMRQRWGVVSLVGWFKKLQMKLSRWSRVSWKNKRSISFIFCILFIWLSCFWAKFCMSGLVAHKAFDLEVKGFNIQVCIFLLCMFYCSENYFMGLQVSVFLLFICCCFKNYLMDLKHRQSIWKWDNLLWLFLFKLSY